MLKSGKNRKNKDSPTTLICPRKHKKSKNNGRITKNQKNSLKIVKNRNEMKNYKENERCQRNQK